MSILSPSIALNKHASSNCGKNFKKMSIEYFNISLVLNRTVGPHKKKLGRAENFQLPPNYNGLSLSPMCFDKASPCANSKNQKSDLLMIFHIYFIFNVLFKQKAFYMLLITSVLKRDHFRSIINKQSQHKVEVMKVTPEQTGFTPGIHQIQTVNTCVSQ